MKRMAHLIRARPVITSTGLGMVVLYPLLRYIQFKVCSFAIQSQYFANTGSVYADSTETVALTEFLVTK